MLVQKLAVTAYVEPNDRDMANMISALRRKSPDAPAATLQIQLYDESGNLPLPHFRVILSAGDLIALLGSR